MVLDAELSVYVGANNMGIEGMHTGRGLRHVNTDGEWILALAAFIGN